MSHSTSSYCVTPVGSEKLSTASRNLVRRHCRMQTGAAFTLIELLVVVAVISVLASMLLPSLMKAKAAVKSVSCLSNYKQIYVGYTIYAEEMDDYIPNAAYWTNGWQSKIGGLNVWGQGKVQTRVHQDFSTLYKTVSWEVLECPAEQECWFGTGGKANGMAFTRFTHNYYRSSYSQNWSICRPTSKNTVLWPGNVGYTVPRKGFSVGPLDYRDPATADILSEAIRDTSGLTYYNGAIDAVNSASASHAIRHPNFKVNVMYWDGHAEGVVHKQYGGQAIYHELYYQYPGYGS